MADVTAVFWLETIGKMAVPTQHGSLVARWRGLEVGDSAITHFRVCANKYMCLMVIWRRASSEHRCSSELSRAKDSEAELPAARLKWKGNGCICAAGTYS